MFLGYFDFIAAVGIFLMFFYMLMRHSSTWLHKTHIGNVALAAMWPLCQYSVAASGEIDVRHTITAAMYVSIIILAHNWLLFVLQVSQYPVKLSMRVRLPLMVPMIVMLLAMIGEPVRAIFFKGIAGKATILEFGSLFWWLILYTFSYCIAAVILILIKLWKAPSFRRSPLVWMLFGYVSFIAAGMSDVYYNVIAYPRYDVVPGLSSLGLLIIICSFSMVFCIGEWANRAEASFLEEIHARNLALIERNEQLKQLSITDELTGSYNRRFFQQHLLREIDIARRHRTTFSILLIDVDNFKVINDTYGHLAGDSILVSLAELIRGSLRKSDVLARIGGEEFALYLPHTSAEAAAAMADRIRELIVHKTFPTQKGIVPVTVSIGVASTGERVQIDEDARAYLESMLERADAALYRAKAGGRNQIISAE